MATNASPAELVIPRLNGVRQTGPGRYIARCPAHKDRSPSLTVRELDDRKILLHCFGGCDVSAVVGALGLTLADLFPPGDSCSRRPERAVFAALDVLRAIRAETTIVCIAARQLADGTPLADDDLQRLRLAYARISEAVRLAGGGYGR